MRVGVRKFFATGAAYVHRVHFSAAIVRNVNRGYSALVTKATVMDLK